MTSTLVETAGSASANTYATLTEALAYHDDRPAIDATWDDSSPEDKNRSLLYATKLMDAMIEWAGWPATTTQALLWPRTGLYYRTGVSVPSDVIPTELKNAQAELAGHLIRQKETLGAGIEDVESFEIGELSMTFRDSATEKMISAAATLLLPPGWFTGILGQSISVPLMRA